MVKDRDPETDWALQVALTVSGFEKESGDVVVVTNLWLCRIILLECVAAKVTLRRVLILFPFLNTFSLHQPSRAELLHDRRFPLDERL